MRHPRTFWKSQAIRRGFSLVEVLVSTFLSTIVLVASLMLVGSSLEARISQSRLREGALLASDLIAEISRARYEEPDDTPEFGRESSESGGSREDWDDIDDYDSWSSPPQTKDGMDMADYADWNREVKVRYVSLNDTNGVGSTTSDEGLKRVTVTVTDPNGHTTSMSFVRSRFGSSELDRSPGGTVVTEVGIDLQITNNPAAAIRSAAAIFDHAPAN